MGLLLIASSVNAQDNEFAPGGKPVLRIFSNYNTTITNGETGSAFELQRVYLGYEHNFSEYLSGKAVLDIGNPGAGKLQMTAYVKNAYLQYKNEKFVLSFGLISTTQFSVQESAWGNRYIAKSFQDEFGFNSSADLGISAAYQIFGNVSVDVIVSNGEGYKSIQADSTFRTGAGITVKPFKNLTARVYYDFSNKVNTQASVAGFLGYENEKFNIGAEYVVQLRPEFVADRTWSGASIYSKFNITDNFNVFGRYDMLTSNTVSGETTDWNIAGDGQWYIIGFEYSPVKGVKLAPNFKGWNPFDNSQSFVSTVILNLEVKF